MHERTHALIVAVQDYHQEAKYSAVPYAIKDAEDFAEALILTGVPNENVKLLIGDHATKTGIETELILFSERLGTRDRGIFYFAGHGVYTSNSNFIVPVDGYKLMTDKTCVSIDHIMGMLKDSKSTRNLIFLDCCHSGFRPGKALRDANQEFEPDDLLRAYKDEEYCWGFASCTSSQSAISSSELGNGVWTHYLVKALRGDAGPIYESGILFSDRLQEYLKDNVPLFVKKNTEDRSEQTPFCFGSLSDRFIVANLNQVFEERTALAEAAAKENKVDFTKLSMKSLETGKIKDLPGFLKSHRVPDRASSATKIFVVSIGKDLVSQEIERLFVEIKNSFNYTRKAIKSEVESDYGSITTSDFTFYISIRQDEDNPTLYVVEKEATEMNDPTIIQSNAFDKAFDTTFNQLVFTFSKRVNLENLIDSIEELGSEEIKVIYKGDKPDSCTIKIKGLDFELQVEQSALSILSPYAVKPAVLVDAFRKTIKTIGHYPNILLLN